jgi:DNA-binding MarR family transcriptional regulator
LITAQPTVIAFLPLPTLLSQALVAFTIEFDNEFEHQMPHWTSNHGGSRQGPWLVSLAMWSNCMQFIGEEGLPAGKLADLARTPTNLNGMVRWGYVVIAPDPADNRPKPPRSQWVIRATPKGRMAQEVWRPLFGVIEKRWQDRFGKDHIDQLRKSLGALISRIDTDLPTRALPDCLPILGYGLYSRGPDRERPVPAEHDLTLSALLSRVLLAFAIEFERESDLSLAIGANVLRVLNEKGVPVRDLPVLSGVSKEAIAMALGVLRKKGVVVVEQGSAGDRTKVARLTPKGLEARGAYRQLLGIVEERWQVRFGKDTIRTLRELLERLAGEPLFRRFEPYADGWRESVRKPETLPHYPMVLHRGGFPDGS